MATAGYFFKPHYSALILVLGLFCLVGCAIEERPTKKSEPPKEPMPAYKSIINAEFSTIVKNPNYYAPYQISGAQWVNSFKGWAWLVCVKGNNRGEPIYFSVFIQHEDIIDFRTNVSVDMCTYQSYEPFSIYSPPLPTHSN